MVLIVKEWNVIVFLKGSSLRLYLTIEKQQQKKTTNSLIS